MLRSSRNFEMNSRGSPLRDLHYVTISSFLLDYSICVLVDAFIRFMIRLLHVILLYSSYIALRSIAQAMLLSLVLTTFGWLF